MSIKPSKEEVKMGEIGRVAAGIGVLIALGLILSHWQGTVGTINAGGAQINQLVRNLSLYGYSGTYTQ